MNNYRKSNQPIRLTEQDLHFLVEEAVKGYLVNEGVDEDFMGKINGARSWWNNRKQGQVQGADQQNTQQVQTEPQQNQNFLTKWGQKLNNAGQQLTNFKQSVNRGGANGDAQKYINSAVTALQNLIKVDDTMTRNGGKGIGGPRSQARKAVETALNYLNQSQGGYNMRNRFSKSV